jgi:DNA-binding transcriptional ArsR family regulator
LQLGWWAAILADMSSSSRITQEEAITELLAGSGRAAVPIRKSFVQQGGGAMRVPGPLTSLCTHHNQRGLDLYLLIHARASAHPFDVAFHSTVWARLIGLTGGTPSDRSAVSKALRRLEDLGLISKVREKNLIRVFLREEDGRGGEYRHPGRGEGSYFKLPYAYWHAGWHRKLKMPGKTLLLIALSLSKGFILPEDKGPDWYGLSPDTVGRGLNELEEHGLLDTRITEKRAPLSPIGTTKEHRYMLRAPFDGPDVPLATVTALPTQQRSEEQLNTTPPTDGEAHEPL